MSRFNSRWVSRAGSGAAFTAVVLMGLAAARAQPATAVSSSPGRIDFAAANLPPATVEVDLSQAIFSDLFGLGDAAIAGVIESLTTAGDAHSSEATELLAEKLAAARQILQLAQDVVHEVRVRVYEDFPDDAGSAAELTARFDGQLNGGRWDRVVRVRDGNDSVQVSFLRVEGSILGIFVVVGDGNDIVLANVVCDVSPENIKKLAAAATKIGLEHGLREAIEHELRHLH